MRRGPQWVNMAVLNISLGWFDPEHKSLSQPVAKKVFFQYLTNCQIENNFNLSKKCEEWHEFFCSSVAWTFWPTSKAASIFMRPNGSVGDVIYIYKLSKTWPGCLFCFENVNIHWFSFTFVFRPLYFYYFLPTQFASQLISSLDFCFQHYHWAETGKLTPTTCCCYTIKSNQQLFVWF